MKSTDVLIIGGGVVGVSIAYYAAAQGATVRVVERGGIGSGSSRGNAGLLVPSHCQPLPCPGVVGQGLRYLLDPQGPLYIHFRPDIALTRWLWRFYRSCTDQHLLHSVGIFRKLSIESLELHQELARVGGGEYEYAQEGLLTIFISEKAFLEAQDYSARVKSYGIETVVLSADAVRDREPEVGPHVIGGLYHRMDGRLEPAAFVRWLAREAGGLGAELMPDTEVLWLEKGHRRVASVMTTRGELHADQIVIAGGAWTPRLTDQLGIRIPIQSAKGYSLTFDRPAACPKLPLLLDEARIAVTPFAESLRIAGTLELGAADLSVERKRLVALQAQAYRYLPRCGEMSVRQIWRGLRPVTPDGLPVFGRLQPYSNVLIAGGHGTKGMLLGPVTGKYISQMLAGESIGMVERSLRPQRF